MNIFQIVHSLPYMNPIHASSITCITHIPNIKKEVFDKIKSAKTAQKITSNSWPINGGTCEDTGWDFVFLIFSQFSQIFSERKKLTQKWQAKS